MNVALALQRKGARVGLMDADVYGPNTPQMLGITRGPEVSAEQKMIPPEAHGIKVISMGMLVPADQPIIWRGPMLHGAVQQFMRDVVWGELDYLIVDLPPVLLSDDALMVAPLLDAVVLVVNERRTKREDVARVIELLGNTRIVGTVLNRSSESENRAY